MIESINLSNGVGAVLIVLNAALVAWIVWSTWQEKLNEPRDRLASVLATRVVDLAFLCGGDDLKARSKLLETLKEAHVKFVDRNLHHGMQVSVWFAEEVLAITFAAANLSPRTRYAFVLNCLKLLDSVEYRPGMKNSYRCFDEFVSRLTKQGHA